LILKLVMCRKSRELMLYYGGHALYTYIVHAFVGYIGPFFRVFVDYKSESS